MNQIVLHLTANYRASLTFMTKYKLFVNCSLVEKIQKFVIFCSNLTALSEFLKYFFVGLSTTKKKRVFIIFICQISSSVSVIGI